MKITLVSSLGWVMNLNPEAEAQTPYGILFFLA